MDISNFDEVAKCIKILDRIKRAKEDIGRHMEGFGRPDPGGIPGVAEYGYSCHLSEHKDGSGKLVDLNGCYVGDIVYKKTKEILEDKEKEVIDHLENLGVDTDNWN